MHHNTKMSPRLQELYDLVAKIPPGTVVGYGAIGRCMQSPVSGVLTGKWMANCPPHLPWWRVVGADGTLKTNSRDPHLAQEQKLKLEKEGITFENERINPEHFLPNPELILTV